MDLADDDGPNAEELAAEIRARYNRTSRPQREVTPFPDYPLLDDPPIWRVRVKVFVPFSFVEHLVTVSQKGFERDAVVGILQKANLQDVDTGISCVFMRDTIPGWIYIEAFAMSAVHQVLAGIPGVLHARDQIPITQAISMGDRIPLLVMSDTPSVGRGSWVRLQTRGLYRNDLGFVLDFDERVMDVQVAVVPRIELGRKRVKRPERSLFNLEEVKHLYGHRSVEQRNQIHIFQGQEFKNGLLELSLSINRISTRNVNPTRSELDIFTQCTDSSIVEAGYREMVQFNLHDRVEVIAGQLRGLEGRLADTERRGTVVVQSTAALDPLPIRAPEIRKKFCLGDRVKIISGEHRGAEGFIIDMEDENSLTLYCPPHGGLYSASEGFEVSLARTLVCSHLPHIPQLSIDPIHIDFESSHQENR